MAAQYQVRAKTACEAVGLDRDRFNEEVAAGLYPCAPKTDAGKARVFFEPDLVALYIYAKLRRIGMSAESAASAACRVGDQARQLENNGKPISGDVVIGIDHLGASFCGLRTDVQDQMDGNRNGYSGTMSPMILMMTFAIGNILHQVKSAVAEITAPIGED